MQTLKKRSIHNVLTYLFPTSIALLITDLYIKLGSFSLEVICFFVISYVLYQIIQTLKK